MEQNFSRKSAMRDSGTQVFPFAGSSFSNARCQQAQVLGKARVWSLPGFWGSKATRRNITEVTEVGKHPLPWSAFPAHGMRLGQPFDEFLIINVAAGGGHGGDRATPRCFTHPLPFLLAWRKEDKIGFFPASGQDEAPAPHPAHLSPALPIPERGRARGWDGRDGGKEGERREGEQGRSGRCVAWRPQTLPGPGVLRGGDGHGNPA